MQRVKQGQTAELTGLFTDKDNTAADPSVSKVIRITNPDGTLVVTDSAMTTDGATGQWFYAYAVAFDAPLGEWKHEIIGSDGATPDVIMGQGSFVVGRRIGPVVTREYPSEVVSWTSTAAFSSETDFDSDAVLASPTFDAGSGNELYHYSLQVEWTGSGSLDCSVTHAATDDVATALQSSTASSDYQTQVTDLTYRHHGYSRQRRYGWVVLKVTGDVTVTGISLVYSVGVATYYGHYAATTTFGGVTFSYRIAYPPDMRANESLPLVISGHGSAGVGNDNWSQMEQISFARAWYDTWYWEEDYRCISVVPQALASGDIPAPYDPAGTEGEATFAHPDVAGANGEGWYCQGILALITELLADGDLPIDSDRVYFCGFSWGGKAVYELARESPSTWAAMWATAGWAIGRSFANYTGTPEDNTWLFLLSLEVEFYKQIPWLIVTGENDTTIPYGGQIAITELDRANATDATYIEMAGKSHVGSHLAWYVESSVEWLFNQSN